MNNYQILGFLAGYIIGTSCGTGLAIWFLYKKKKL